MEASIIDPLLEIDAHDPERRQCAIPVVARVDVVGADLADGVVHEALLDFVGGGQGPGRRIGTIAQEPLPVHARVMRT